MACRVLIVDDVRPLRELWAAALSADPEIEVVGTAADGVEALQAAEELRPDVMILDLSMPRMDGLEVIRTVTDRMAEIRIIVFSGFAEGRLESLALELGASAYVEKGVSLGRLARLVKQVHAAPEP